MLQSLEVVQPPHAYSPPNKYTEIDVRDTVVKIESELSFKKQEQPFEGVEGLSGFGRAGRSAA